MRTREEHGANWPRRMPIYRIKPFFPFTKPIVGWYEGKKLRSMVCPYDPTNDILTARKDGIQVKLASGETVVASQWEIEELT